MKLLWGVSFCTAPIGPLHCKIKGIISHLSVHVGLKIDFGHWTFVWDLCSMIGGNAISFTALSIETSNKALQS